MQLIIISPPDDYPHEPKVVSRILQRSATIFHLRKPGRGHEAMAAYLRRIPTDLHPQIMVHDHADLLDHFALRGVHVTESERRRAPQAVNRLSQTVPRARFSSSFHSLSDLSATDGRFDYVFLSPIFDSISKIGYRAAFDHLALTRLLSDTRHRVFALGGVDGQQVARAASLGFTGVAVLGAVWNAAEPLQAAIQLSVACRRFDASAVDGRSPA